MAHPILDWNMSSVVVEQDSAENIKFNEKESTEKIDGVTAMVMGFACAAIGVAVPQTSVYD